jgi:hypothetical protein
MNEKEILIELLKFNELQLKLLKEQINVNGVEVSEKTIHIINSISILAFKIANELRERHNVSSDELIEILEKIEKKDSNQKK